MILAARLCLPPAVRQNRKSKYLWECGATRRSASLNVEQLLLMAPLVIELIVAVIIGIVMHRRGGAMTAIIGLIVVTALLMNVLPSPIKIGSMTLDNSVRLGLDLQGG